MGETGKVDTRRDERTMFGNSKSVKLATCKNGSGEQEDMEIDIYDID